MNIKNQKVITIQAHLDNNNNTFSSLINLSFTPQYFKVKLVSVTDELEYIAPKLLLIKSTLINSNILTHFTLNSGDNANITYFPNIEFKLFNQFYNGNYEFSIWDINNNSPDVDSVIDIAITLEFIEYN